MKKFNFFREDLELNKKWWHRLFKILFIVLLFWFFYKTFYIDLIEESFYHYKRIANLEDRLTDKVSKIEDLLKYWERFEDSNWQSEKDYWSKNIYCSNKLYDIENINYIIKDSWINNFDRFFYDEGSTSVEEFSKIIKSDNIKCIIKDNAQVDFLNPMEQFNNFWFYEKSVIQYIKDTLFIQEFFIKLFLYVIAIYIFYYWIIMYIIYWRKSNN